VTDTSDGQLHIAAAGTGGHGCESRGSSDVLTGRGELDLLDLGMPVYRVLVLYALLAATSFRLWILEVLDVLQDEIPFAHPVARFPVKKRPTLPPSFAAKQEVHFHCPSLFHRLTWLTLREINAKYSGTAIAASNISLVGLMKY